MPTTDRKLRVFLCHASQDKLIVRELYQRLLAVGWIDPWLDEEKLLPGQDWDLEIDNAVKAADAVIVCFSTKSVIKEGYIQKELRKVLDIALEKPEGEIFVIPIRLDDCNLPSRVKGWQYIDYFPDRTRDSQYDRLLSSLQIRKNSTEIKASDQNTKLEKIRSGTSADKKRGSPITLSNPDLEVDSVLLRKAIHSVYDLPDFEILCSDLGLTYDDLRGSTFETKILALIEWHRRRNRFGVLVRKVLEDHPYLSEVLKVG